MTLTEQWKKGELPCGWYYIKIIDIVFIDFFEGTAWNNKKDECINKVLAPVPSYEEYNRLKEVERKKGKLVNVNYKIKQENQRLKELLKRCRDFINYEVPDHCIDDVLIDKIDNAIGEKK